jgi:predicted nucleic acid-binding protein
MYTLEANIFVRDANPHDADHRVCHALLERLYATRGAIVVPSILSAEVAGPLSRTFRDPIRARVYVESLAALPTVTLVPLDAALAREAAEVAADHALRGMDVIYVAVARHYSCTLVTLDDDPQRRASTVVTVLTPAAALAQIAVTPPGSMSSS